MVRPSGASETPDPNLFVLRIDPGVVLATFRQDIVGLLRDFSVLYSVPIALILNGRQEYLSGQNDMSSFCQTLWNHADLRERCLRDHQTRDGQKTEDLEYRPCHAGLLNLSLALDFEDLGKGTLLAGQRSHFQSESELKRVSEERYHKFVESSQTILTPVELSHLHAIREAEAKPSGPETWTAEGDLRFVRALGKTLESYIPRRYHEELHKMRFERAVSRLLHELSNTSVYMDLNSHGLIKMLEKGVDDPKDLRKLREYASVVRSMAIEARYETVNLLQALKGDTAGLPTVTKEPEWIDVMDIVRDLWPAFTFLAQHEAKQVRFEAPAGLDLRSVRFPKIRLFSAMIRRALYNVFSNALKYSYSSSPLTDQGRFILIKATPKYSQAGDMFALSFSNYGIAFESEEEKKRAVEFGFRGKAAVAERPIGSGIGLNEVDRIMRFHGGFLRIQSEPVGKSPALTVVWIVFRSPSRLTEKKAP